MPRSMKRISGWMGPLFDGCSSEDVMRAMTILKEMIVVRDITNGTSNDKAQINFMLSAGANRIKRVGLSASRSFLSVKKIMRGATCRRL